MTEREKLIRTMSRAARNAPMNDEVWITDESADADMEAALDAAEEQLGAVMAPLEATEEMVMRFAGRISVPDGLRAALASSPYRKDKP